MFVEIPQQLILSTIGAFLLGWLLSSMFSAAGRKYRAKRRDPRDDRIRELEAEVRIAQTDLDKTQTLVVEKDKAIEEAQEGIEKRDNVITHQQGRVEELRRDLKESVLKTRELRAELSNRAEENVRSEVKLREVETELSVAQASSAFLATGVLDYSMAPENEDDDGDDSEVSEAAK